jgi:hypothetical protein
MPVKSYLLSRYLLFIAGSSLVLICKYFCVPFKIVQVHNSGAHFVHVAHPRKTCKFLFAQQFRSKSNRSPRNRIWYCRLYDCIVSIHSSRFSPLERIYGSPAHGQSINVLIITLMGNACIQKRAHPNKSGIFSLLCCKLRSR